MGSDLALPRRDGTGKISPLSDPDNKYKSITNNNNAPHFAIPRKAPHGTNTIPTIPHHTASPQAPGGPRHPSKAPDSADEAHRTKGVQRGAWRCRGTGGNWGPSPKGHPVSRASPALHGLPEPNPRSPHPLSLNRRNLCDCPRLDARRGRRLGLLGAPHTAHTLLGKLRQRSSVTLHPAANNWPQLDHRRFASRSQSSPLVALLFQRL